MKYERHETLKHIGKEGQEKLLSSRVGVIGLGALGSVAAELLVRSGVGLFVIDPDFVDDTNLQRQVLYDEGDVGKAKAIVAKQKLAKINSDVEIDARVGLLTYENVELLEDCDVVLDCTDNMHVRFLINDYCKREEKPWIYSGAVEDRGFVYVTTGKPCFACIFEKAEALEDCETAGILNSASAAIAALQAKECVKLLLGYEAEKDLLHFNVWNNELRKLKVSSNPECKPCNGVYEYLEESDEYYKIEFCKSKGCMAAKPLKNFVLDFERLKREYKVLKDGETFLEMEVDGEEVIVYNYGEIAFKKLKDKKKIEEITKKFQATSSARTALTSGVRSKPA